MNDNTISFIIVGLVLFIIFCCMFGCCDKKNTMDKDLEKIQSTKVGIVDDTFSLNKIRFEGHDYLIFRANGLCHSASCPCMKK